MTGSNNLSDDFEVYPGNSAIPFREVLDSAKYLNMRFERCCFAINCRLLFTKNRLMSIHEFYRMV